MLKEKYRISFAPDYLVANDGHLYRLSHIDAIGRVKNTKRIISFSAGPSCTESYDIQVNGKIKRFSKKQLIKFYVEIKEENQKIILLPNDKY